MVKVATALLLLQLVATGCTRYGFSHNDHRTADFTTLDLAQDVLGHADSAMDADGIMPDGVEPDGIPDGVGPDGDGVAPDAASPLDATRDTIPTDTIPTDTIPGKPLAFTPIPYGLPGYADIAGNSVTGVEVDGPILVAGTTSGVSISTDDGTTWRTPTVLNGLGNAEIQRVAIFDHSLYLPTFSAIFRSRDEGGSFEHIGGTGDGFCSNLIKDAHQFGSTLYVVNLCSFAISDDDALSYVQKRADDGMAANGGTCVFATADRVYVGSGSGLNISGDGGSTWSIMTTAEGLPHNSISDVFVEGNTVYVGTRAGLGLSVDEGPWEVRTTAQGLVHDRIRRVRVLEGALHVATDGGLSISRDGAGSFVNRTTVNGLPSNYIRDMARTPSTLYAATSAGLALSHDDGVSWPTVASNSHLPPRLAMTDVAIVQGRLYWGTSSGLAVSVDGGFSWTTVPGLPNQVIRDLHVQDDVLYVATRGGLAFSANGTNFTTL
ncbi:MAG: hypothetical protein JRH20_21825, partial [Deltaproteobacteria bacterium]|nr:hypothetical protein [Deltaproteobacteria bacterium]